MLTASPGEWAKRAYIAMVVAIYFVVSISMVFVNKKLLQTTQFDRAVPVFIMWYQCLLAVLICVGLGKLSEKGLISGHARQTFDMATAMKVMPLSAIFVGMILFNQLCLQYVEVSFYNVARSLTIVFNVVLSYIMLNKTTSWKAIGTIAVVIYGFFLGAENEVNFSLVGTLFGVFSSLFVALNSVYTSSALEILSNDKSKLVFYNNLNSFILLCPLMLFFEGDVLFSGVSSASLGFWTMMVIAGALGFVIGIVTVWQIQVTSPLTHNISGTAKASVQTVLAIFIWDNEVNFMGMLGVALILGGSFAYSVVKMQENQSTPVSAAKPAPVANTEYDKLATADDSDIDIDSIFDDVDVGELDETPSPSHAERRAD